jgi:hypothetical protein
MAEEAHKLINYQQCLYFISLHMTISNILLRHYVQNIFKLTDTHFIFHNRGEKF